MANVKNYSITNIDTNAKNPNDIEVSVSLDSGVIIKSGESKKLNITIRNKSKLNDIYYKFNFGIIYYFNFIKSTI